MQTFTEFVENTDPQTYNEFLDKLLSKKAQPRKLSDQERKAMMSQQQAARTQQSSKSVPSMRRQQPAQNPNAGQGNKEINWIG